jgi:tungstate transport system substrate-binding protein
MHRSKVAPRKRRAAAFALAAALTLSVVGCAQPGDERTSQESPGRQTEIILASTTSTQDSGLFDVLVPAFEAANPGYRVKVVAVGTGEALKLGENKDADVLLVHAKADEEKFIENGFGVERADVMYNDYVIVGPAADPAGVKRAADMGTALAAAARGTAPFVSRGDDSGTHKKELKLWAAAGVATPTPDAQEWYLSTGQGMGDTLKIASEKGGYTLTDRATYLSMRDALDLVIVREDDADLLNQYGVIVVADTKNQEGGQVFCDWVLSTEGQDVIAGFGIEEFGEPLFTPNAQ